MAMAQGTAKGIFLLTHSNTVSAKSPYLECMIQLFQHALKSTLLDLIQAEYSLKSMNQQSYGILSPFTQNI